MTEPLPQAIRVDSVTRQYGSVTAVDNVSFDVAPGEFVSLLGPSGCGKTTTLRMIAGFILPTSGRIVIDDRDVTFLPPNKRNVGFVFQNYALWPHMTVYQNIAFGLRLRGRTKQFIDNRVQEVLATTGLIGYQDRLPAQLSGGQQQRVALSRALALDPPLLLMDEPLSNLDRALRVTMRRELKILQSRLKVTTLYVTHDQEEALSMSDRVILMGEGRIVRIATPKEIYEDPQLSAVADFVGAANFFEGVAARQNDGIAIVNGADFAFVVSDDYGLAQGANVRLMVRPERLRIVPRGTDGVNVVPARIELVEYFGATVRYTVSMNGQRVYSEGNDIDATYSAGDEVAIVVAPDSFRVVR